MKKTIQLSVVIGLVVLLFAGASCSKKSEPQITVVQKVDTLLVKFSNSGSFAFFNFRNGKVVANSDSATTKWDFGMRRTTFILNSHAYGPGNAAGMLLSSVYSSVLTAPGAGFAYDTTTAQKAIKDGSWYDYNPVSHSFVPKAGKTFIFRTADNFYVKMELLAVDYAPFVGPNPSELIYRFRYTYQANGTKTFL